MPPSRSRMKALGAELRRLRTEAGVTQVELGKRTDLDKSKVSRIENGTQWPDMQEVIAILYALGVPKTITLKVIRQAEEAGQPNWLAVDSDDELPAQLATLIDYEQHAKRIFLFSPLAIPGLLQTRDYARVIFERSRIRPASIPARMHTRMERQHFLTRRRNPVELHAIIDEPVLARPIDGGTRIAIAQLRHLLAMGRRSNVTIQVIPYDSGAHASMGGNFMLLEFAAGPPVAHAENGVAGTFIEEDLDGVIKLASMLRQSALSPADSTGLIRHAIDRLETT